MKESALDMINKEMSRVNKIQNQPVKPLERDIDFSNNKLGTSIKDNFKNLNLNNYSKNEINDDKIDQNKKKFKFETSAKLSDLPENSLNTSNVLNASKSDWKQNTNNTPFIMSHKISEQDYIKKDLLDNIQKINSVSIFNFTNRRKTLNSIE